MGRYLGPKHRLCRRAGQKLCDNDRCPATRRPYPPGIHGQRVRRKATEYGTQLLEKQKARHHYGILERQLRQYYERAMRQTGDTNVLLVQLLERRLDNVVFRCGFAKTHAAARQLIAHGHMTVNGTRMTIPSYQVCADDVVRVRERSKQAAVFKDMLTGGEGVRVPSWISMDRAVLEGRVIRLPSSDDIQLPFRTQSIVEFYSR